MKPAEVEIVDSVVIKEPAIWQMPLSQKLQNVNYAIECILRTLTAGITPWAAYLLLMNSIFG